MAEQSHPELRILGAQIREQRQRKDLTQAGLALLVGVSRTSVANLEGGRQNPGFVLLGEIAAAFGLTVAGLLSTEVTPERHRIVSKSEVHGQRKIISYWCELRGCETRGRISAIPHATADGIFALAVKHHEEIEDHEGGA